MTDTLTELAQEIEAAIDELHDPRDVEEWYGEVFDDLAQLRDYLHKCIGGQNGETT